MNIKYIITGDKDIFFVNQIIKISKISKTINNNSEFTIIFPGTHLTVVRSTKSIQKTHDALIKFLSSSENTFELNKY